jgi:formylglycine-generating enzyme
MLSRFASLLAALTFVAACSSHTSTPHPTSSGTGGSGGSAPGTGGSAPGTGGSAPGTGGSAPGTGGSAPGTGGSAPGTGGAPTDAGPADGATFDCAVEGVPGNCIDTAACAAMTDHLSTSGLCPGAANIECCTPYSLALCDPAAKPRPEPNAGNTVEAPGEGGCPAGMVRVTTFCVDKYEATLVVDATGDAWCPFDNPGATPMRAISVAGAVPQAYIDGVQAGEACTNAGKRLCLDTEWLRACQGPTGTTYPYGNTDELGVCNDHRAEHPAVEYFGTTASWIYTMLESSCIDQLPETVDLTGSRTGCVTAEGAYDMMGNVHEWTADTAGTFRGGYFMDTVINGPGCLYATTAHDTAYWDYSTGFRCCAD